MRDDRDRGLRDTFESLYTARYQEIAGYVRRRVPGPEAEDLIAQVFAVAWRRIERVPSPPGDRLWLYGVARNTVTSHHRSEHSRLRLHARLSEDAATPPARRVEPDPRYEPVRAAMSALRQADREALQLVLWEDLSHREAAAVLGCSENAFELRYRRARNAVRDAVLAGLPARSNDRERSIGPATISRMNQS